MKKLFLIIISVFFIVINVNAQWVFEKKIDEFTDDIAIYIYNETPIKTSNNIKEQFITIGFDKETIWVSLSFGEYIGTLYPDTNRGVQVRIRFDKDQYTVEKWRLSDSGYYLYTYYPPYELLENIINHKELLIEATKSNNDTTVTKYLVEGFLEKMAESMNVSIEDAKMEFEKRKEYFIKNGDGR